MGTLTETEIFDCLKSNLRLAAQHCEDLAVKTRKGPTYHALRTELKLIEGCCRQVAYWRGGDARWLRLGLMMEEAHKRAGDWLRGIRMPDGGWIKIAAGHLHPLFVKLAENLRALYSQSEKLQTSRTNSIGPILPKPLPGPHRDTRPVGWSRSAGGIIVPQSAMVQ